MAKPQALMINLMSFLLSSIVPHGGQLMTEGQLMIMCEIVADSQHIEQEGLNADIYTNCICRLSLLHYGEFNTKFCTGLQDASGCWKAETSFGSPSIPRMVWDHRGNSFLNIHIVGKQCN